MIKGFALLERRPDISAEAFHAHWRGPHAELALAIPTLRRYVQSHRLARPAPGFAPSRYEGIAEIWFDDLDTALALPGEPQYAERLRPDEANFIAPAGPVMLFTREHVVVPGPPFDRDTPAMKALFLTRRREGMSVEDFQAHWLERHAPLAARNPGMLRYVQCHVCPELYERGTPAFDGVAELWWPDLESLEAAYADESVQADQIRDLERFIDFGATEGLLAEELRLIWPGAPGGD